MYTEGSHGLHGYVWLPISNGLNPGRQNLRWFKTEIGTNVFINNVCFMNSHCLQ